MSKAGKKKKNKEGQTPRQVAPTPFTQPAVREYVKHMCECKCILPQYRNTMPPVYHKFVVFSEIELDGSVVPSYAQCTNCGVIHRITEVGSSTVLRKEEMPALMTMDDYKKMLPEKVCGILELHECSLPCWQEAHFIIKHKLWGRGFVLTRERDGDSVMGKYLVILGESIFDIRPFERTEGFV